MCQPHRSAARGEPPKWTALYAVIALGGAASGLAAVCAVNPGVRVLIDAGAGAMVIGGLMWWLRANGARLDQAEWCACAARTVRVRVVSVRRG